MHMIAGVLQYVAVASFAEAWIEKYMGGSYVCLAESPPSRRRGLKSCYVWINDWLQGRLLRGGVDWKWWHILLFWLWLSRLLRGGVDWKKMETRARKRSNMSPPSRRRGLKISLFNLFTLWLFVASFAEAWIEKWVWLWYARRPQVASFAEAWIEKLLCVD